MQTERLLLRNLKFFFVFNYKAQSFNDDLEDTTREFTIGVCTNYKTCGCGRGGEGG